MADNDINAILERQTPGAPRRRIAMGHGDHRDDANQSDTEDDDHLSVEFSSEDGEQNDDTDDEGDIQVDHDVNLVAGFTVGVGILWTVVFLAIVALCCTGDLHLRGDRGRVWKPRPVSTAHAGNTKLEEVNTIVPGSDGNTVINLPMVAVALGLSLVEGGVLIIRGTASWFYCELVHKRSAFRSVAAMFTTPIASVAGAILCGQNTATAVLLAAVLGILLETSTRDTETVDRVVTDNNNNTVVDVVVVDDPPQTVQVQSSNTIVTFAPVLERELSRIGAGSRLGVALGMCFLLFATPRPSHPNITSGSKGSWFNRLSLLSAAIIFCTFLLRVVVAHSRLRVTPLTYEFMTTFSSSAFRLAVIASIIYSIFSN